MNTSRDPDRLIHGFLLEGAERLNDRVYDAVRADIDMKRQRAFVGPWRLPTMIKLVPIGLGAAALVAVLVVGSQMLGAPVATLGPGAGATPTPAATAAAPSVVAPTSTLDGSLAVGPFLVFDPEAQSAPFDDGPPITVTIPASGWSAIPEFPGVILKGEDADPPAWTGAGVLTGDTGGDAFYVYGDPCKWESTTPETPATTVDEIVEALAAQASRDATTPVDVMVGGHAGKSITLTVPNTAPNRAEAFKDCDQNTFATYNVEGLEGPTRYQQGPGQVDEFWILDVDGVIVILDATYGPATPAELVEEVRTIIESATFG